uniref:SAC domain-containing protein n=1 Tax=Pseudo-nitzschia australis TaxID=44445 RepID=A0A7S4AN49_9STRA
MSDDGVYRLNNTMIAPLCDDQKKVMSNNVNVKARQCQRERRRQRQRRRNLVASLAGGPIGIGLLCLLILLSILWFSASAVAAPSSSSVSTSKTKTTRIAPSTTNSRKKRKHGHRGKNPFRKERTIISGFGSRSIKKTVFSPKRTKLVLHRTKKEDSDNVEEGDYTEEDDDDGDTDTDRDYLPDIESPKMWVQRSKYDDGDKKEDSLWILIRDSKHYKNKKDGKNIDYDHGKGHIVLKLSFDDEIDDWVAKKATRKEESEFVRDHPLDEWIPVDGLYGSYRVPSGILWILITGTEAIYEAPPIASSTTSTAKLKSSSWWQIRRVTNLEIVHLGTKGYNQPEAARSTSKKPPSSGTLTASQLREEVRQLSLLRKALKQHDFYYVPNGDGQSDQVIHDMTKTIQRSILESDSIDSDRAASNKNTWWNDNDQTTSNMKMPDPRFFWNQHAVEPLLRRYQDNNEKGSSLPTSTRKNNGHQQRKQLIGILLQHIVPLTSAFVGVQTNLTVTSDDDGSRKSSTPLSYDEILISRRSRFRAGTRFTVRGADALGNCANFAETEQICLTTKTIIDNYGAGSKGKKEKSNDKTDHCRCLQSVASHVQTRGSIPLRWSSPADIKTYRPRVNIGADPLAQARAVRLHILDQLRYYTIRYDKEDNQNNSTAAGQSPDLADIIFVNLVDKHSDQGRLGRAFEAVMKAVVDVHGNENSTEEAIKERYAAANRDKPAPSYSSSKISNGIGLNSVKHVWYDFHAEVKNGRWDRLSLLLDEVEPSLEGHGYFLARGPSEIRHDDNDKSRNNRWSIQRLQNAVIRTNCMDCLDRTNVVQSIFGRYILFQQLSDEAENTATVNTNNKPWTRLKNLFKKKSMKLPWETGEVAHRSLWADNADAISRLYAGTPALKGDFTRTGKRTKRGALDDGMNSLQRYYLNNFLDADRQEGYDLLVGHAGFSNIVKEIPFCDDDTEETYPSFLGATRESILSDLVKGSSYQRRGDLQRRLEEIGVSKQPDLDLRWLPGDLQTQLRDQTSDTVTNSVKNSENEVEKSTKTKREEGKFCSQQAMKAIDERSHADSPWWSKSDGDWLVLEDQDEKRQTSRLGMNEHRSQVLLTPTQLAVVFYLGFKAPLSLVGLTISILSFVYIPECFKHDYRRQKSLKFNIQDRLKQKNEKDELQ